MALLCRLPIIFSEIHGNDAVYHAHAALTIIEGGQLYTDTPYTYPPLYAYTEAVTIVLLGDSILSWKATVELFDFGSVVLIYFIA
jgi:hypothetical protein